MFSTVLILEQMLVQQLTDFSAGADLFLLHGLLRPRFAGLKGNSDSMAQGSVDRGGEVCGHNWLIG